MDKKPCDNKLGSPDQIDVTDLEDTMTASVPGVQSLDAMEFTANYTPEAYESGKASELTDGYYSLKFGENGADGVFTWQGQHTVYVNGGEVNGAREMTIVVLATSAITKS